MTRYSFVVCDLCKGTSTIDNRSVYDGTTTSKTCHKCGGHRILRQETRTVHNTLDDPDRYSLSIVDAKGGDA